jgi:hypothetical protein
MFWTISENLRFLKWCTGILAEKTFSQNRPKALFYADFEGSPHSTFRMLLSKLAGMGRREIRLREA